MSKARLLGLLGLVVMASAGVAYFWCRPRIHCERASINLGAVESEGENVQVSQKFVVENRGWRTLKLHQVAASCTCTHMDWPREIAPLSKAILTAQISFPADSMGTKDVAIAVASNDPRTPIIKLSASLSAKPMPNCYPRQLDFGKIFGGAKLEMELVVNLPSREKKDVTVRDVAVDGAGLEVMEIRHSSEERVSSADQSRYWMNQSRLRVMANGDRQVSRGVGSLRLVLANNEATQFTVPCRWESVEAFQLVPRGLHFGVVEKAKPSVGSLSFTAEPGGPQPEEIRLVKGEEFRVQRIDGADGTSRLLVTFQAPERAGRFTDSIEVALSDGTSVSAPLTAVVR